MTAFPVLRLSIDPQGHLRLRRRMPRRPSPGARDALDSAIGILAALDARVRRGLPLDGAGVGPDPRQGRGVVLRLDPESRTGEASYGPGFHHLPAAVQRQGIAALLRAANGLRSP
jgi:hypothetical protein